MRRRASLVFLIFGLAVSPAHATMPSTTDPPKSKTEASCKEWASNQNEVVLDMWGIQEDGSSLKASAISRLAAACLGYEAPEIVGFGSSAGFDEAYCERHPNFKICKKEGKASDGAPKRGMCVVNDPSPTLLNYRTAPSGRILGKLDNGQAVKIIGSLSDRAGKAWVYVADKKGAPFGWIYRAYVACPR